MTRMMGGRGLHLAEITAFKVPYTRLNQTRGIVDEIVFHNS